VISSTSSESIPEGWRECELGELVHIKSGFAYKSTDWVDDGVPVIKIANVRNGNVDVDGCSYVTQRTANETSSFGVSFGDLLMTLTGEIGAIGVYKESFPARLNQRVARIGIKNSDDILFDFLRLFLESPAARQILWSKAQGMAQPNISPKEVLSLLIQFPPLDEQEKIVEILEEQLSRLDVALASVNAVRKIAARFRLSLLHAAFTGALTGHDSSTGAIPESWELIGLESLLSVSIGGIWGEESGLLEIDVDVVRVTELKAHGVIEPSTAARRSITRKQFESRALQIGDLLLEKSGGGPNTPVGRVGYVSSVDRPTVCSNFMQLMRPDSEKVCPVFLHLFLTFIHSNGETIPMQTSTTNIRNIKTPQYMAHLVPCPQLDEQESIIQILDEQLSRLDSSLAIAGLIEKKASAMRRSLLHAAFTGELTKEWREDEHV